MSANRDPLRQRARLSITILRGLAIVLLVALAMRLGMALAYGPVLYNDTNSYRRLAASVQNGFQRYDGTRTPGYPAFLALFESDQGAWLAQMGLGVLTSLLYFAIGWQISGRALFGTLAGLAHTLNLGQVFFEANLITETLATFWVALTLAGAVLWLRAPHRRALALAFGLGLSASLAWLTRPLFIFLPFWVALFLALRLEGARPRLNWQPAASALLPALILVGVWANLIHSRFHMWSLTVMTGFHLVQHSGHYFEFLPDEEAALRDTYLSFREAQIRETGNQTNTIWDAIPAMQEASGLSFYDLSRRLAGLSVDLILAHPDLYLRNVVRGWWLFWRAPVYWSAEALQAPALAAPLSGLILLQRAALFGSNMTFVVTSLVGLVGHRWRKRWGLDGRHWLLAGGVWLASVIQTLLDHGDNPRFLVPLQTVVVVWVMWVAYRTLIGGQEEPGDVPGTTLQAEAPGKTESANRTIVPDR